MKLLNTSGFPDDLVREVYRFTRPNGVGLTQLRVRRRDESETGYSGHSWAFDRRIVVTVRSTWSAWDRWHYGRMASDRGLRAASRTGGDGYLDFAMRNPVEVLVVIVAHENRHQWQHKGRRYHKVRTVHRIEHVRDGGETIVRGQTIYSNAKYVARTKLVTATKRRRGMVWGARGVASERDADAYALRMLRAWRRAHPVDPVLNPDLFEWSPIRRTQVELLGDRGWESRVLITNVLTGEAKMGVA